MKQINEIYKTRERPIRIAQFGEGNFLRAFCDWMIDIANEKGLFDGNIAIVKPIPQGDLDKFYDSDCLYTVLLRGLENGSPVAKERVVNSIAKAIDPYKSYEEYMALARLESLRFIISNTTEAGIALDESDSIKNMPPNSYPGKLTVFLYERYKQFDGAEDKGLIILPVELIEDNGKKLKETVLRLAQDWNMPRGFCDWVTSANTFCSTLVDRIVTGYPAKEIDEIQQRLGYEDKLLVTAEPFGLWVIECDDPNKLKEELPLDMAGLPVIFTEDMKPYRERKVRILNGAHTSTVLAAYLAGFDTVGELMKDKIMRRLIETNVFSELLPFVPLPADEVKRFALSVLERFENPYIRHELLSISLNSVSKFKSRILPSIKDIIGGTGSLPYSLCFSLAALMNFYSGEFDESGKLFAMRGGNRYEIKDEAAVLEFFAKHHKLPTEQFTRAFLGREDFFGEDLNALPGFADRVCAYLNSIREKGMRDAVIVLLG